MFLNNMAYFTGLQDVECVINYDFPQQIDTYVHRVGRTARGERKGNAYTFIGNQVDGKMAKGVVDLLKRAEQVSLVLLCLVSRWF